MQNVEVYAVTCRRCDVSRRVPGWSPAAEIAHKHAEHGGSVQIQRVWLRATAPAMAA